MGIDYYEKQEYLKLFSDIDLRIEHVIRKDLENPPKILFVNGALATSKSYFWAKKELSNCNLIFFNLPHFETDHKNFNLDRKISMDLEVRILIELIKKYRPDFLISMSWGGYSALQAMADEPEFIKRALVASFSGKITAKMRNFIIEQEKILSSGDIHEAIKHFNYTLGFYIHRTIKKLYVRYFSELGKNIHVVEHLIRHFRDLLKMEPEKYLEKFSNIKASVMFLNGKLDDYTPGEYAHNLAAVIPQSTVRIVDGASHFLILENQKTAREVKGIIRQFFT